MKIKVIDILESICDEIGNANVHQGYHGRGMYNSTCLAISVDHFIEAIEKAAEKGVTGARIDNLGMGYIVYWPRFTEESEIDEVELVDVDYLNKLEDNQIT